jgi:hypothetical protein
MRSGVKSTARANVGRPGGLQFGDGVRIPLEALLGFVAHWASLTCVIFSVVVMVPFLSLVYLVCSTT